VLLDAARVAAGLGRAFGVGLDRVIEGVGHVPAAPMRGRPWPSQGYLQERAELLTPEGGFLNNVPDVVFGPVFLMHDDRVIAARVSQATHPLDETPPSTGAPENALTGSDMTQRMDGFARRASALLNAGVRPVGLKRERGIMEFVKIERVSIRSHSELNERWVQDRIAEDPTILGFGDVVLKDKERIQPRAGRLDLLLQDADSNRRYEVEVQLGATDESHLVRTIEYWDIERKRYPQYDHVAVIVAEDITSRFLNVIGLFNGMIPIVAIQMNAMRLDDKIGLVFTTVLDQMTLGLVGDDEEVQETTDRNYWEARGSKKTVAMADKLLEIAKQFDAALELKYNKFYIGLAKDGNPSNFLIFRPKKSFVRFEPKLKRSPELEERLEQAGLDLMDYDTRWGRYRIRLQPTDVEKHADLLTDLIREASGNTND
jgi:hypothetical protein